MKQKILSYKNYHYKKEFNGASMFINLFATGKDDLITLAKETFPKIKDLDYCLGGALAVNFYSKKPRNTSDIDIVFNHSDKKKVIQLFKNEFPDINITPIDGEFLYECTFSGTDAQIDLMFAIGDPEESMIVLAKPAKLWRISVKIPPIELLILQLAYSDRKKHLIDLENLLNNPKVDIDKLMMYIDYIGDSSIKEKITDIFSVSDNRASIYSSRMNDERLPLFAGVKK